MNISLRSASVVLLICTLLAGALEAVPERNPAGKKAAVNDQKPVREKGAAAKNPGQDKAAVRKQEAPRDSAGDTREKSRFAGRVTVNISPARYQLFYIYLFSRKELDSGIDQSRRTSEKFYPSKINILYEGTITLDDIMGTGASAGFSYSGKYPVELGVSDDTKSDIHHYATRLFWPAFGVDAAWLDYRSFIRMSERPETPYSKGDLDTGMRAQAITGNVYLRLVDLYGQNSDLLSMLDPTKRDRFNMPFSGLFFLLGSYDNLRLSSGTPLVTAPLQTAFDNMKFDEYQTRIYSGALMLGVKWMFWSNFFLTSSVAAVSAYRVEQKFISAGGTITETDSGVESIYSSMEKYRNFQTNPAESYTKQLIHAAAGYRGDGFFCYAEYFWDVKNLKSEKVVVQYSTYDLKLVLGAYF